GEAVFSPGAPLDETVTLRQVDPAAARRDLAAVFDAARAGRPGMWSRDDRWWGDRTHDPEHARAGRTPLRCVVVDGATGPRGYAMYAVKPGSNDYGVADQRLSV